MTYWLKNCVAKSQILKFIGMSIDYIPLKHFVARSVDVLQKVEQWLLGIGNDAGPVAQAEICTSEVSNLNVNQNPNTSYSYC